MKNTVLFIASILISISVIEWSLRSIGFMPRILSPNSFFVDGSDTTWSVPDPELGWINKEGISVSIESGAVPMTFWSYGRRASRPSIAPPASGMPVMIVGGSNAQSYGVRDEESFPYLLAQRFPGLWVENFGNGGFGTAQALLLTERAVRDFYKGSFPKLIILTFSDAHIERNVSDHSWIYSISDNVGRYVSPPHFRIAKEGLSFHPFETINLWPTEQQSALITALHNIWLRSIVYATANEGTVVTRNLFEQFVELGRSNGSEVLVVILEDYRGVSDNIFSGASFPVLDCSGFERNAPEKYLLGGGSHPNALLHLHFTDCISRRLQESFELGSATLK